MRKVRPFVVRVKRVPQYLVLYSLEAKHSTLPVPFRDRAGRRVKHRFWLVSGLYLGRHLPDFRAGSFGTTAGPRSRIGWKKCKGESSECQEKNQLHIFGASVEKRWMVVGGWWLVLRSRSSQFPVLSWEGGSPVFHERQTQNCDHKEIHLELA